MTADLLRAPTLAMQLGDHRAELLVGVGPASMTCSARGRSPVSIEGLIAARPGCCDAAPVKSTTVLGRVGRRSRVRSAQNDADRRSRFVRPGTGSACCRWRTASRSRGRTNPDLDARSGRSCSREFSSSPPSEIDPLRGSQRARSTHEPATP